MARSTSKLTTRKKYKSSHSKRANGAAHQDQDDYPTLPDDAKWKTMTPYGVFAISDKDGVKHRFKRGDFATILPHTKPPGVEIEPHEYWVGQILEIRADAGSEDSTLIWTKVKWFYDADDASVYARSIDKSTIGKFERFLSDHWDYVLPHAYNQVISIPKLYTFPFLRSRKSKLKKESSLGFGKTEAESESGSLSTATNKEMDEENVEMDDQVPIGPEMFYWRYKLDLVNRKIHPKQGTKSCICLMPYSPDVTSLLDGVMLFCPRPACRTFFHLGCLKSKKSVFIPDDEEVIVCSGASSSSYKPGRSRGPGDTPRAFRWTGISKNKAKSDVPPEDVDEVAWITPRALRRLTTSPDSNEPIDLLSLLSPNSSSQPQITQLLERIYARQLDHNRQSTVIDSLFSMTVAKNKYTSLRSGDSTKSGGSVVEVEDMLIEGNDETHRTGQQTGSNSKLDESFWDSISQLATLKSRSKPQPMSKQKQTVQIDSISLKPRDGQLKVKPLTPVALLASLFLLASPFPPSYASIASSSQTPVPINTSNTATTPKDQADANPGTDTDSITSADLSDLLLLSTQPLIRGAGFFPDLGPTGNVNMVLEARKLVWEILKAVGSLDLSPPPPARTTHSQVASNTSKKRGSGKSERKARGGKRSVSNAKIETQGLGETQGDRDVDIDAQDADQWRKITECVQGIWIDWKRRVVEEEKVIPPGAEFDHGIIVKDENHLFLPIPTVMRRGGKEVDSFGDRAVEMTDGTDNGVVQAQVVVGEESNVEGGSPLRSGKKRKRLPDEADRARKKGKGKAKAKVKEKEDEMLLKVDWACLNCGGLL